MLSGYLLVFCRVVTGLLFLVSSVSKARHPSLFTETITNFHVLPKSLSGPAALILLSCEFAVVMLMAAGGTLVTTGFLLAALLLLVFCSVLASVLARRIDTSCNCFGANEKPVSTVDVWRNIVFLLCALCGYAVVARPIESQAAQGIIAWVFIGLAATVFVIIWTQLGEIVQLFHKS